MTGANFQLGSFAQGGAPVTGLVIDGEVISLRSAAARYQARLPPFTIMADLLADWDRNFDELQRLVGRLIAAGVEELTPVALQDTLPLPPLGRTGKALYAAANYADHVANMRRTFTPPLPASEAAKTPAPLRPYMFAKPCAQSGAYDDIVLPHGLARIDWEAELMVVIGVPGRNIPSEGAGRHIAGYMTTNDVSCRDLTWREDRPSIRSDWLAGKSFDSFAPVGPVFTPKAFVPDHSNLAVRLWINGQIKQDGNTRDMTFGVEAQIEYASRLMTLLPGDCIATGTPAGTGQERLEFLREGDLVEAEVEGCGRQRNRVVAGPAGYVRGAQALQGAER